MGLGTKNRQKQTADICKQHLREKYQDQRGLVEESILEFEGARENCDVTRWDRFTDIKDIKKEMRRKRGPSQTHDVGKAWSGTMLRVFLTVLGLGLMAAPAGLAASLDRRTG
jgi:hypothetical protein